MDAKVRKDTLLGILKTNRSKHREVFEAALNGYRLRSLEILEQKIQALSKGRTPVIRIDILRPEDHTRDYDRIIKMIELDTRDEMVLSEREAAQYVMDDWSWKRDFVSLSSRYASGVTQQAYGPDVEEDYFGE